MKIDFHVHTSFSIDSTISIKSLIKKSNSLGIIPAITDHNSISANSKFKESNAKFIPGEEIKTDIGDLIGFYLNELIPKNTSFLEALDKIQDQGGISYLPHGFDPLRYNIGNKFPEYAKKVDIIEVFNARCITSKPNELAMKFALENKKLFAGGSDSHFLFEFGKVYTELSDFDIENPKKLINALKKKVNIHGKLTPKYAKVSSIYSKLRRIKKSIFG
ncbi:MAG: PHP domain-containing protein [Candidatus ainarchaeum sp.]|nr:PHP domain-containing protein [Candidatus ainarchaeum sp.]